MKRLSAGAWVLIRLVALLYVCMIAVPVSANGAEKHVFEAEAAGLVGGASKLVDTSTSDASLLRFWMRNSSGFAAGGPLQVIKAAKLTSTRC